MPLTPFEREVIQRRAEMPVASDGWQSQYVNDVPQLLDALAEVERHADSTTEGWRLEAIRLRDRVIEVETERRELQARIAQDDEERSVMTSVRAALERVLADVRDDLADRTGLLSWIAEQLGSRCIEHIRTDLPELFMARDEAVRQRDHARAELDAGRRQFTPVVEASLQNLRDLLVTQGDTLHRIGKALGVEVVTLQNVEDAARMFRDRVTELDARLADAAEQADTYKGLADRLGDFIKEISAALHVEPGDEILGSAKALHAELEQLRANRPGPILTATTAALAADEEVFGRLGALLDCPASVGHITEAIRRLVIAHRRALQDVSDRDRWLAESSVVTTRLQAKLAKIRMAADLD